MKVELLGVSWSKTVFNLSHKTLTKIEIKVLEKRLDFAPVQRTLNEPELREFLEEFSRRMICKWPLCNENVWGNTCDLTYIELFASQGTCLVRNIFKPVVKRAFYR